MTGAKRIKTKPRQNCNNIKIKTIAEKTHKN